MIDRRLAHSFRKYNLTPAQLRLAIALFKGESVQAYSIKTHISINTARWHVREIYDKIGVHRQNQLSHQLLVDMGVITA